VPVVAVTGLALPEIRRILPHGPAMVLLDRVERLLPGREIRAVKLISGSEPCYAGLDDRLPLAAHAYPRSLVLESFGQAAAVLWLRTEPPPPGQVLMFVAARECRFSGHAYPGDVLRHVVRLEHHRAGTAFVSGYSSVAGERIASFGSLAAVVRPRSALAGGPATPPPLEGATDHG
jgi:3-hydroxyacyl-[acyl-carrier-protein] dehydratase